MEKEKTNLKNDKFLEKYNTVFAFLGIEIVSLTLFGLGGATGITIFSLLGFFLSLLIFPYVKLNFGKEELKKSALWLIPIAVLIVLIAFSRFWITSYSSKLTGIVISLSVCLGLCGASLLGAGIKHIPGVHKKYVLLGLGSALALLVIIVGITTFVKYGFFYTYKFKGMVYYYDGVLFKVFDEAKVLDGFSIKEAMLEFAMFPAFLLSLFGTSLFYLRPKTHKKEFIIAAIFTLIGLLYLVLVPYMRAIYLLLGTYAIVGLFALYHHLMRNKTVEQLDRYWKYIFGVIVTVFCLGVGVFIICSLQTSNPLAKISSKFGSEGFFGKVSTQIFNTFFQKNNADARSLDLMSILFGVNATSTRFTTEWNFMFNVLIENGFVAFCLLIGFIFLLIKKARHYFVKDNDEKYLKIILVALIVGIIIYQSISANEHPYKHNNTFVGFTRSSYLYLLFFIFGYVYFGGKKKKELAVEEGRLQDAHEALAEQIVKDEEALPEKEINVEKPKSSRTPKKEAKIEKEATLVAEFKEKEPDNFDSLKALMEEETNE